MRVTSSGMATTAREIGFSFDGRALKGHEGESIAAALTANGMMALRRGRTGDPRGVFCGMGVCFECLVAIDGRQGFRACMTRLVDGMRIETQDSRIALPGEEIGYLADDVPREERVETPDVLVVGAGPAGLQAARAAALIGADVVVIDERLSPGGQYFKQLADSHSLASVGLDAQMREGRALIETVRALGVRIHTGATVWGAFKPREIAVTIDGRAAIFQPRALVIATGAYERGMPVPGWTLPGFMTTGAAQTLLRSYQVAAGGRVLIAGNGPLNFQLAVELAAAGVEIVALAESAPRPGLGALPAILAASRHSPELMRQGWRYLRALAKRGIPLLHRHVIVGAEGDQRVRVATLAPLDADGHPSSDRRRRFEVDAVCVGYGFEPVNEIARALGCRHAYDPARGAIATIVDADRRSSCAGIFVAGDCAGMGGARAAQEQGFVAGVAAARHAGCAPSPAIERELAQRRHRLITHQRFQAALWRLFEAPRFEDRLAAADTLICRCESVSHDEMTRAIGAGLTMAGAVKRITRAGMGRCQGRYCAPLVIRACAAASGRRIDEFSGFAPRPPLKPVPIAALARARPDPLASDGNPASHEAALRK